MLPQLPFLLLASLAAPALAKEFPAKVQVDLIFPKNETYAPTGYFPVVYAVHNFQLAEPLKFDVHGTIKTHSEWTFQVNNSILNHDYDLWRFPGRYQGFRVWGESWDLDPMFFVTSISTITNGTDDHFHIGWKVDMDNCTDLIESRNPGEVDSSGNILWRSEEQRLEFSVASDGKVPDIEEAIRDCNFQSLALDVKSTDERRVGHKCGDIRNVTSTDKCGALKDYAEEVAMNVSERVLARLGCEEGTWQDIREDCPSLAARFGQQSGWGALAIGVITGLLAL